MSKPNLEKLAKDIGKKVRDQREKKELSLNTFSEKAEIDSKSLWNIEKGRNLPSIRILAKIGHALKVKLRELLP